MPIMTNAASPARRFAGDHLVIASHNKGKIPEIAALLEGRVPRLTSAAEHGVPEPEETGDSFIANAELKARFVAEATGFTGFFLVAVLLSIPGLLALQLIAPIRQRDVPGAPAVSG